MEFHNITSNFIVFQSIHISADQQLPFRDSTVLTKFSDACQVMREIIYSSPHLLSLKRFIH